MKLQPHPWFAGGSPPPNFIRDEYLSLPIDAVARFDTATVGAALFGDSTGFDFSRIVAATLPSSATLSVSPVVALRDGGLGVVPQLLDTPLRAETPTQQLSDDRTPVNGLEGGVLTATLLPPPVAAADLPVSTASALQDAAPSVLPTPRPTTLAASLSAEDPSDLLSYGRIPDLGFLQNLPATAVLSRPSPDQSETAIRPADSAVLPLGPDPVAALGSDPVAALSSEPVALPGGGSVARSDLIHELTAAIVATAILPPTLFEHDAAAVGVARDLFVSEPATLPDFASVQFAAVLPDPTVLPDPIVDPGPLV